MLSKILLFTFSACFALLGFSETINSPIVIMGNNGAIVSSPDGVIWSQQPSLGKSAITTTMGHNNYYVALAANGCSFTSSNGFNWQTHCDNFVPGIDKDILWADDKYLVLRSRNQKSGIYTSIDGIQWEPIYQPNTSSKVDGVLTSMTYTNGMLFVSSGEPCGNAVLQSKDLGLTWKKQDFLLCINGVTSSENKIIVFGFTQAAHQSMVSISNDQGGHWAGTKIGTPGQKINWVTYANNRYIAVGENHGLGILFTSEDAKTWVQQKTPVAAPLNKVVWVNTQYIAFGKRGVILTSPDGMYWTLRDSKTNQHLYDIAW